MSMITILDPLSAGLITINLLFVSCEMACFSAGVMLLVGGGGGCWRKYLSACLSLCMCLTKSLSNCEGGGSQLEGRVNGVGV